MIPLCHFQSLLEVLALCSDLPKFSGIWFLTSFQHGQGYNLCFSVPACLLRSRRFISSDQQMSYILFCAHPHSTTNFLVTCRCFSVHISLVFLRSMAWIGFSRTLVFSCSVLSIDISFFQLHLLRILRANHSRVHRHLPFKKRGECHCGHVMPMSLVSHMTAPAGRFTCLQVCTSKICSSKPSGALFPMFPTLPQLPDYSLP